MDILITAIVIGIGLVIIAGYAFFRYTQANGGNEHTWKPRKDRGNDDRDRFGTNY